MAVVDGLAELHRHHHARTGLHRVLVEEVRVHVVVDKVAQVLYHSGYRHRLEFHVGISRSALGGRYRLGAVQRVAAVKLAVLDERIIDVERRYVELQYARRPKGELVKLYFVSVLVFRRHFYAEPYFLRLVALDKAHADGVALVYELAVNFCSALVTTYLEELQHVGVEECRLTFYDEADTFGLGRLSVSRLNFEIFSIHGFYSHYMDVAGNRQAARVRSAVVEIIVKYVIYAA